MASTIFLIIASVATAFMLSLDLTVVFTMALLAVALAAPLAAVSVCLCRPRSRVKAGSAPKVSQAQGERRLNYTSKELMAAATKHTLADGPTLKDLESLGPASMKQQAVKNRGTSSVPAVDNEPGFPEPQRTATSPPIASTSRTSFPYPPFNDNAAAERVFWVVLVGGKPGCFWGRKAALKANPNLGGKTPLPAWTEGEANKILSLAVERDLVRHI